MAFRSKKKGFKPWETNKLLKAKIITWDGLEYERDTTHDEIKKLVSEGKASYKNGQWVFNFKEDGE